MSRPARLSPAIALVLLVVLLTAPRLAPARSCPTPGEPAPEGAVSGTFSIVAVDPEAGICGAAVASKYPGVGRIVPHVRAGVGAFCTQHWHEPKWGQRALDLLASGKGSEEVLADLLRDDPNRDKRQLAIIDMEGRAANRNPARPDPSGVYWGSAAGKFYACQGNTLRGREVIAAMAAAYEDTRGSLADRMMAALVAGDCAGGDHRGRLAAGILVAKRAVEGPWLELQVDESQDAVADLLRKYVEIEHEAKGEWPGGKPPFRHPCPPGTSGPVVSPAPEVRPCLVRPIRVVVWDERQPEQRPVYPDWIGNHIAAHLRTLGGVEVRSVALDDPGKGLGGLDECDVLVWWGHVRHGEVPREAAIEIVRRIEAGKLSLLALHASHWSRPFVEAMGSRARADAISVLEPEERATASVSESTLFPEPYRAPGTADPRSPSALYRKTPEGSVEVRLTLPNCCFPAYRADGKPSQVRVLRPNHPIAHGLPARFVIENTEMYGEPFHVPPPDEVVLEERWESGEWFRSCAIWRIGKGTVVYLRPGHETYPVYRDPLVLELIGNTVLWLGGRW
jgi:uncharacterized Ntn-hydrolase superfamily protein/trehalose utilization protein